MILDVGKIYKSRFSFMKKTFIFEYGDHAIVLEKEKRQVTLYATDAACSVIYCVVPLGAKRRIRKDQFVAICYSQDKMLVDGGDLLIVVDFGAKKVAVNDPSVQVIGKKDWGEDAHQTWRRSYNVMFGLPGDEMEMDRDAAAAFWKWFAEGESTIIQRISAGGEEAQEMIWVISRWLAPVFPYEKESDIEFQLGCNEGVNQFFMYHFDKEPMKADTEELGRLMPESLREHWEYITEA